MTNDPDESTRLLPGDDEEAGSPRAPKHHPNTGVEQTPLPKAQLGALLIARIVDPIAYQQIFPYINQLLADMNVAEPEQVGFYSGLVESAYSLAQVFSVYQWARLSDIVGRRPVVLTGLIGIGMATMAFGLSTSFSGIVASRFFGGLVAGNVAVIHSILAEITDETNQDIAVPIYGLGWPGGTAIGPIIGGLLANAATRYPRYFSWHVFVEHPYLPPCVVTAACALVGAGIGYAFIEETLPGKRKGTHSSSTPRPHADVDSNEAESVGVITLLSIPAMRALTLSGFAISFLSLGFDVVFTLICYTPINAGGLGLEPATIGNALALAGALATLFRFSTMTAILRRFDYAKTYNACMYTWPVAFGLLPLLNVLARTADADTDANTDTDTGTPLRVWTGLIALLALSKVGAIPHSLSMLLVKRHAPSPGALGRCNGVVQFAMCVGRTVAPIVVSALFTGVNGIGWIQARGLGWVWAVGMVVGGIAGAEVTRGIGSGDQR